MMPMKEADMADVLYELEMKQWRGQFPKALGDGNAASLGGSEKQQVRALKLRNRRVHFAHG
jgi:hypothetical protein